MNDITLPPVEELSSLPTFTFSGSNSWHQLKKILPDNPLVYIIWDVQSDIPNWVVGNDLVAYIGQTLYPQSRLSHSHHVINPLASCGATFNISFVNCCKNTISELEERAIKFYNPRFNHMLKAEGTRVELRVSMFLSLLSRFKGSVEDTVAYLNYLDDQRTMSEFTTPSIVSAYHNQLSRIGSSLYYETIYRELLVDFERLCTKQAALLTAYTDLQNKVNCFISMFQENHSFQFWKKVFEKKD